MKQRITAFRLLRPLTLAAAFCLAGAPALAQQAAAPDTISTSAQAAPANAATEDLSPREREVLDCLSQGLIYKEIAEKLGISYETVHTYIRRIYEKLQVRTRTEAVAKFLRG